MTSDGSQTVAVDTGFTALYNHCKSLNSMTGVAPPRPLVTHQGVVHFGIFTLVKSCKFTESDWSWLYEGKWFVSS